MSDTPPRPGQWDYFGACDPLNGGGYGGMETFSLGCFQWQATKDGKGVKKGRVVYRVKGHVSDPEEAHRRAKAWCDKWNARAVLAAIEQEGKG